MSIPKQIHFGAFAPKLSEQGFADLIDANKLEHLQKDADAISRLSVRGIIPDSVVGKARERLGKTIFSAIEKPPARAAIASARGQMCGIGSAVPIYWQPIPDAPGAGA